jgi:MFS family permease
MGSPYWRLWSATTVSGLGDGLALVALPLLAASVTRSPALVAGVFFVQRLPWLLLALPAGVLVDRLPRARVMVVADAVRALVVGGLALAVATGSLELPLLYLLAFALGALETVFVAASNASVPLLVSAGNLERANGYLYATITGGEQMVGPAVGGVLFALAASAPFAVDAASFVVSAVLLVGLGRHLPAPRRVEATSLTADLREGVRFFRASRELRLLSGFVGSLAFLQAMVMGTLVLFALEILRLGEGGYGLLLGVAAVGNVLGGLLAPRVRRVLDAGTTLALVAFLAGLAYAVLGATSNPTLAAAALFVECLSVACGSVVSIGLRQSLVPDELRGRVGNVFMSCIWGVIPLGTLAGGVMAGELGLRAPLLVAGAVQVALVVAVAPALRRALVPEPVIDLTDAPAPVVAPPGLVEPVAS